MKSIIDIERGDILHCPEDGFMGVAVGFYTTLHGLEGVVLQPQDTGDTEIIRGYEVSKLEQLAKGVDCDCPTCRADRSKEKTKATGKGDDRVEFHMMAILGAFVEYKSMKNKEAAMNLIKRVDEAGAELTATVFAGRPFPYPILDKLRKASPSVHANAEDLAAITKMVADLFGLDPNDIEVIHEFKN